MTEARTGSRTAVVLAVGKFGPEIGGPYQTVSSYARVLSECGVKAQVLAMPSSGTSGGGCERNCRRLPHRGLRLWWSLAGEVWKLRDAPVVIFGVWHPVFFAFGLGRRLMPRRFASGRRVLSPTQSLTPWDWAKHRWLKRVLRPLVVRILHSFDLVIFATQGEMQSSTPAIVDARSAVVYHPIAPMKAHPADAAAKRIVSVGRIVEQKDIRLFLETIAGLPPDWSADVVGSGTDRYVCELMEVARDLGCEDRVRWHGWLSRDETHEVVVGAGALVVTSWAENYSHASVEAMMLGVPVVMVSRVAAAVDLARFDLGVVTPPTPEALVQAVLRVDADSKLRARLLQNARAFAVDRMGSADGPRLAELVVGGVAS